MSRGVIECGNPWFESAFGRIEDVLIWALQEPLGLRYRYRVGKRAVMLWPESEMGKVVELG